MAEPDAAVEIAFRIPGRWSHPKELVERLPAGYRLTPESLILPDKTEIGFGGAAADDQFAKIFRSSLRQDATAEELQSVDSYTINIFLMGPGGSLERARTMMEAAAAIVRAGGAGVFIDNSGLAHGGQNWLDLTADGGPEALTFAYVSIIGGTREVWTMGMHALGLRDVVMQKSDVERGDFDIIEVICYLARGEKPVEDGHILADLGGPRFQATTLPDEGRLAGSSMHNPFGRLKLVSMRDIAETN